MLVLGDAERDDVAYNKIQPSFVQVRQRRRTSTLSPKFLNHLRRRRKIVWPVLVPLLVVLRSLPSSSFVPSVIGTTRAFGASSLSSPPSLSASASAAAASVSSSSLQHRPHVFSTRHVLPPLHKIGTEDTPSGCENDEHDREVKGDPTSYDYSQPIPCLYTNDVDSITAWMQQHLRTTSTTGPVVVGWDMESAPSVPWRDDEYVGPATLQLSTVTQTLVIQLAQNGYGPVLFESSSNTSTTTSTTNCPKQQQYQVLPPIIEELLSNPNIILTGVGIHDDIIELYRWVMEQEQQRPRLHNDTTNDEDVKTPPSSTQRIPHWAAGTGGCSFFDLGRIGALSPKHYNTVSLKRLVAGVVGLELVKSKQLARSPWGRVPLRNDELCYAARDAWSAAAIVHKLTTLDPERFSPEALPQGTVLDAEQEKINRELFVGNTTPEMTEQMLRDFLGNAMEQVGLNVTAGNPITSCRVSGKFAFVELRTKEEAANALNLNNIPFMGAQLRVGRPSKWSGPPDSHGNWEDVLAKYMSGELQVGNVAPGEGAADERDENSTTQNTTTTTYSVAELSHRAAQRKALKNHAKDLKEARLMFQKQQQANEEENVITPTRVPMTTAAAEAWMDEEKFREELLWTEMKVLSPTPPIYYEIQDSLNIFIANK